MAKPPKSGVEPETTPKTFPEVPPSTYTGAVGTAYLVESMMQMQHSLGELNANVARLVADSRSHGEKIDGLRHQASYIKGGLAVAVVLLGAFSTIASFVLSAKWEAVTKALEALQTIKP